MQTLPPCRHHLTPFLSHHARCFKCPRGGAGLRLPLVVAALRLAFKAAVVGAVSAVACVADELVVDEVADMVTAVSEVGIKGGRGFATLSLLGAGVTVVVVVAEHTRSRPSLLLTVLMVLSNAMVRRRAGSEGKRADRTSTVGTTMELPEGQVVSLHLMRTHSWRVL